MTPFFFVFLEKYVPQKKYVAKRKNSQRFYLDTQKLAKKKKIQHLKTEDASFV